MESIEYYQDDNNGVEAQIDDWYALIKRAWGHIDDLRAMRDKPLEWVVVESELVDAGLLAEQDKGL